MKLIYLILNRRVDTIHALTEWGLTIFEPLRWGHGSGHANRHSHLFNWNNLKWYANTSRKMSVAQPKGVMFVLFFCFSPAFIVFRSKIYRTGILRSSSSGYSIVSIFSLFSKLPACCVLRAHLSKEIKCFQLNKTTIYLFRLLNMTRCIHKYITKF